MLVRSNISRMTQSDDVLRLANHWPIVERNLLWRQATSLQSAAFILANELLTTGGYPVPLGRKRLCEIAELTQGECSALLRSLRELEFRNVTQCLFGRGNQPAVWTFSPDISRWRSMRWVDSARVVEDHISTHICVAPFAFAYQFPDQGDHLRRTSTKFVKFRAFDEARSGVSVVELQRYREDRYTNANVAQSNTDISPVELQRKREENFSSINVFRFSLKRESLLEAKNREKEPTASILINGIAKFGTGRMNKKSEPWCDVIEIAQTMSVAEAQAIVEMWSDDATRGRKNSLFGLVSSIPDLLESPMVRAARELGESPQSSHAEVSPAI
jgi:hypothetical protein